MQKSGVFCKPSDVCTLAIYFRMFPEWPLVVAANRDEQYDRPSASPGLLTQTPRIVAGKDLRAGGTWLGVNEHGVLAAILNRRLNGKNVLLSDARSRGLLCMDLLERASAAEGDFFMRQHGGSYNPFTALIADRDDAYVFYNAGNRFVAQKLPPGLHVFSSAADFDLRSVKADRAYSLFGASSEKLQRIDSDDRGAIGALRSTLGDHSLPLGSTDPGDAICVHRNQAGTVSSSIVFFSSAASLFRFFHCPGAPCRKGFGPAIELEVR